MGVSYAAGLLTTLSPCVLPLLPIVVGGAMQSSVAPAATGVDLFRGPAPFPHRSSSLVSAPPPTRPPQIAHGPPSTLAPPCNLAITPPFLPPHSIPPPPLLPPPPHAPPSPRLPLSPSLPSPLPTHSLPSLPPSHIPPRDLPFFPPPPPYLTPGLRPLPPPPPPPSHFTPPHFSPIFPPPSPLPANLIPAASFRPPRARSPLVSLIVRPLPPRPLLVSHLPC